MRNRGVTLAATIGAGVVLAAGTLAPGAAVASSGITTVTVTMSAKAITLSTGKAALDNSLTNFVVKTKSGDHVLQVLQLAAGYSVSQAKKDIDAAFAGNLKAINHVDTKITWLNGAEATPDKPGMMAISLPAGDYYFVDQNGDASTKVHVNDTSTAVSTIRPDARVTAVATNSQSSPMKWRPSATTLPRTGWLELQDTTIEPHFLEIQQIKQGTTAQDIRTYIKSGSNKPPSWLRSASTQSGVISPDTMTPDSTSFLHYRLPAGEYMLACFWPSAHDGKPHFMMNMFTIVHLA